MNGIDETNCVHSLVYTADLIHPFVRLLPSSVYLAGDGTLTIEVNILPCHRWDFQCVGIELCLSYEMRCNDVFDCPGREDEADCDNYKCPGFYRCRDSKICLHPVSVCDEKSIAQCPLGDDELLCDTAPCPENCTCYGLAVYCEHGFPAGGLTQLRFLEARGSSGLALADVVSNTLLVHLGLGNCGLELLDNSSFPNVRSLDISQNFLTGLGHRFFHHFRNLQHLVLTGNPLVSTFLKDMDGEDRFKSVTSIDMSGVSMAELDVTAFARFPNLRILNVSGSGIDRLSSQGPNPLARLVTLDLRGCPLTHFSRDAIRGLASLRTLRADNYKLCCPATLPAGFNPSHCQAPSDEVSSCDALLRADAYRVVLAAFAVLALVGNLGSFAYRVIVKRTRGDLGFGVFVTHLSVSDFLMGLYLAIIGLADRVYKGTYLWEDAAWRTSAACNLAGFLSFVSSEVSALLICTITLDRFLVLRFPFSRLHFHRRSAQVACAVIWFFGFVLSGIPLLPAMSHWQFYNQNGICIPLPITKKKFPGQFYSFNVMIIFNFVLFLLIAVGQLSIYRSVKANSMADSQSQAQSKDLAIARRLITVAMSDFVCWFPIGLLGLLASSGSRIPGEVNVAMAIFVLPLNSALNPFLYTFDVLMARRRREEEKRLLQNIIAAQKRTATE